MKFKPIQQETTLQNSPILKESRRKGKILIHMLYTNKYAARKCIQLYGRGPKKNSQRAPFQTKLLGIASIKGQ